MNKSVAFLWFAVISLSGLGFLSGLDNRDLSNKIDDQRAIIDELARNQHEDYLDIFNIALSSASYGAELRTLTAQQSADHAALMAIAGQHRSGSVEPEHRVPVAPIAAPQSRVWQDCYQADDGNARCAGVVVGRGAEASK